MYGEGLPPACLMAARDDTKRQSSNGDVVSAMLSGARRPPSRPTSTAERWAMYVFRACAAPGDLKTLEAWAECVGVSYSSLRESCSLLGIRPHDARELTRMLRAVMRSILDDCPPSALLDVSDSRTLRILLERAGVGAGACPVEMSVEEFLSRQRFVPTGNAGLRVLSKLLATAGGIPSL
jgi:hypothetical protein